MQLFLRLRAHNLAIISAFLLLKGALTKGQTAPSSWALARDQHFEVYSQDGTASATKALHSFERLYEFFEHNGAPGLPLEAKSKTVVRVIGFRSEAEYDAFRLRPTADAFFSGGDTGDYVVLPSLKAEQFNLAAHEYAHAVLHSTKAHLPVWLDEGLAEYYSTVRQTDAGYEWGSAPPNHLAVLRRGAVPALPQLLAVDKQYFARESRPALAGFYAKSWALASLLISSPGYASRFRNLLTKLNSGLTGEAALSATYGKSLDVLEHDLYLWVTAQNMRPKAINATRSANSPAQVSWLSTLQADALMADLLLASGQLERAEQVYRDLVRRDSRNPAFHVALGAIAMRLARPAEAQAEWKQAIENGVKDAKLCYQYANQAEERGAPIEEVRNALERAISLEPGFQDARYQLALLESNAANFDAALTQLRAMVVPDVPRAFYYWMTMANDLNELGRGDEAQTAARAALATAQTEEQRFRARQTAYIASTDMVSQFQTNTRGEQQMIMTRIPHGASAEFNPFVEPQDHIRRSEVTLKNVVCRAGKLTAFVVKDQSGLLTLAVPDPQRVLMRNAPDEFACGDQNPLTVDVEFAAQGNVLRGMQFIRQP